MNIEKYKDALTMRLANACDEGTAMIALGYADNIATRILYAAINELENELVHDCAKCSKCQRIVDNEVYCDEFASFFEYENNGKHYGCNRFTV